MNWRRLKYGLRRKIPYSEALQISKKWPNEYGLIEGKVFWELWIRKDEKFRAYFVLKKCDVFGNSEVVMAEYLDIKDPYQEIRKLEGE